MVRPRRMVESLEDGGKESFFCGPPGKLYLDPFLSLMVVPTPSTKIGGPRRTNLGRQKGKEASWSQSNQRKLQIGE